jgi:hypothetical protein
MTTTPILTIHFDPPDEQERTRLMLLPSDTTQIVVYSLQLPFPLAQISLVLRALNARQYPDYLISERLIKHGEDRSQVVMQMQSLGLWDETRGTIADDVHRRVGQLLGNALLTDAQAQQCFNRFYETAQHAGWGELILRFSAEARAFAALPWEVAYDGALPLLMCYGFVLGCTRVIVEEAKPAIPALLPAHLSGKRLHILAVAPRAQMSEADQAFEQYTRMQMQNAFQGIPEVTIEPLPQATMEALRQRLDQGPPVQMLDYFGHGTITKDGGAIVMENLHGGRDEITAQRLMTLPNLPPVIALHACQSAQVDTSEPLNALALALSMAGVHGVLAMQLTIRTPAIANTAAPIFYQKLAKYQSVQQAVTAIRQALHADEQDAVSWFIPVLYLNQKDPKPLFLLKRPDHYPPNPFESDKPTCLIGREEAIRKIQDRLNAPSNVSIVGPAGSGKTVLLHLIKNEREKLTFQPEVIWLPLERRIKLVDAQRRLARALGGETARATDWPSLLKQRKRLIVLIDDIGQLDKGERGLDVRIWLRLLTQDPDTTVRLVTTSMKPLYEIFKVDENESDSYSPFHHVMNDPIPLAAFTDAEVRQFIEETLKGTPFSLQDFSDLWNKNAVPRDLKNVCRKRYDELCQRDA